MRSAAPSRQQGFGLLVFVAAISIVAFSLVLGYAGTLSRHQANTLDSTQKAYLAQSMEQVSKTWRLNAFVYDDSSAANTTSAAEVLAASGVQLKYGAGTALSRPLLDPTSKASYRVLAIYMPTLEDAETPFNVAGFVDTGVVPPCAVASCPARIVGTFSSLEVERALVAETQYKLNRIAAKAQAYFKARMLQDPERNVSVNYFRTTTGDCTVATGSVDLGCLDTYTALFELTGVHAVVPNRAAVNLGLSANELSSGWGLPIWGSNLEDSATAVLPFSMAFKALTPTGESLKIYAIQPL